MKLTRRKYLIAPELDDKGDPVFRLYELVPMRVNEELKYALRCCATSTSRMRLVNGIAHIHGTEELISGYESSDAPQMTITLPNVAGTIQTDPHTVN